MLVMFVGAIGSGRLCYLEADTLAVALAGVVVLGVFTVGVLSRMPIDLPGLFATRTRSTASGVFNLARDRVSAAARDASLFSPLGG